MRCAADGVATGVRYFRTDAQGATTYVNAQWCHLAGIRADEALVAGALDDVGLGAGLL